ncbi:unnamed protein product [Closterium sp. NIES-64]|nr:unnamed protein product [Closterium sp. NIES-64]
MWVRSGGTLPQAAWPDMPLSPFLCPSPLPYVLYAPTSPNAPYSLGSRLPPCHLFPTPSFQPLPFLAHPSLQPTLPPDPPPPLPSCRSLFLPTSSPLLRPASPPPLLPLSLTFSNILSFLVSFPLFLAFSLTPLPFSSQLSLHSSVVHHFLSLLSHLHPSSPLHSHCPYLVPSSPGHPNHFACSPLLPHPSSDPLSNPHPLSLLLVLHQFSLYLHR